MSQMGAEMDRNNLALVLARVGMELLDWARVAEEVENAVLPAHAKAAGADVQVFDALVQHLDQVSAFVLRLSAAADDGAALSEADVGRLARPLTLSALRDRLTGEASDLAPPVSGAVVLWA